MFEQPGWLFCDSSAQRGADANGCGEDFEGSLSNFCDQQVQHDLRNFNDFCSVEPACHQCGVKTFGNYSDCSVIPRFDGRPVNQCNVLPSVKQRHAHSSQSQRRRGDLIVQDSDNTTVTMEAGLNDDSRRQPTNSDEQYAVIHN